jgi:hypothetical protein
VNDPKPRRWGALAWTAVVAVVALGSSLVGLLFELRPDLKRDPRTTLGADVSVFSVDPGVTYREYLEDAATSAEGRRKRLRDACDGRRSCGRLEIPGERIYVSTKVEGFKSQSISMRLSLYDAARKSRIPGASNVDVAQQKLDSPSDRSVVPVWLVCPPDATRRYFVRVELYHRGDGVLLAVGDSARFRARC